MKWADLDGLPISVFEGINGMLSKDLYYLCNRYCVLNY